MAESKQHWLDRNRPPRVQITYDVETGGAIEKKEIPFVVGVMSDLSGATPKPTKLKERKFVNIDNDNFNQVMSSIRPTLKVSVPDKLTGKPDTNLAFDLAFESIDDFRPEAIVKKAESGGKKVLNELYEKRQALSDLLAKLDGNDGLADRILKMVDVTKADKAGNGQ